MSTPRVSILLTCFNHLKFLPAAYKSILDQSFKDYEIIAIDDGSEDGTRDWLNARTEPIQRIFNPRNLGTYASLNKGLAAAQGEFVAIFNDDDLWDSRKLLKQVQMMDSNPDIGLVHTDGSFIDGEDKAVPGSPLGFEFPRFETGDVSLALAYQNKIIASAALVRRQILVDLEGFNEEYFGSGDWEMWIRIAEKWQVGFVKEPLTRYRVHGGNASHKLERIWRDDERLRTWLIPRLKTYYDRFQPSDVKKAQAHNFASLGTVLTLNHKPDEGRMMYLQSLKYNPFRFKSVMRIFATFLPQEKFQKLR